MVKRSPMPMPDGAPSAGLEAWGDSLASDSARAESGSGAQGDFSKTNVQVEGVDEADIVKTDGNYVYSVSQKDLIITQVMPVNQAKVLTTITFNDQPQDIYLDGNKLVVIGNDYSFWNEMDSLRFIRRSNYTFVKVFDISDKTKPKELRSVRIEGNYANSRLIAGYMYLVSNTYNYILDKDILPRVYENDVLISSDKASARYTMPKIYYFDLPYQNFNFTTVSVINLKDDTEALKTELYLLPGGETLYASQNSLYIAYGKYLNQAEIMMKVARETVWPKLAEKDRARISQIEAIDTYILSNEEKLEKINQIVSRYLATLDEATRATLEKEIEDATKAKLMTMLDQLQTTIVHKINIKGKDLNYQGFGEVPGRILNQFSMDESQGNFRIATTRDAAANFVYMPGLSDKRTNGLYVLGPDMKQLGKLEGLAPDEQIYSVRFMQNRAYMVTFQQTDPLFVIDLSQASAPKVLGELKIPGFSQYLHPYNDTILIGLGRNTETKDERVLTKGLKLALFDVSNVASPKEIAKVELGGRGSHSEALNDHKAFLFSKDKNLIAIPASLTKETVGDAWGGVDFSGALIFKVTDKELTLRGKISHNQAANNNEYSNNVRRALYINNNLLTISDQLIKINQLDNLSELNKIQLRKAQDYTIKN